MDDQMRSEFNEEMVKKKVSQEDCPHCEGTGREYPNCEICEGAGWIDDPSDGWTMTCPECEAENCHICGA